MTYENGVNKLAGLHLIEMNEVNLDFVKQYTEKYDLQGFKNLFAMNEHETSSEIEYENLEPWIQWVSVHTGMPFSEHKVFRLGDIKYKPSQQIFEEVESRGYKVGCISPMNTLNRLSDNAVFIPDPWTDTSPDKSFWSRNLHSVLQQTVNDNAKNKITKRSLLTLAASVVRFVSPKSYPKLIKLVSKSRKNKWCKALVLDLLLFEIYKNRIGKGDTDFSTLFLNGFAHIQHHYFLNSEFHSGKKNPTWIIPSDCDPMKDAIILYDYIISEIARMKKDKNLVVATGLSQIIFEQEQFYWRLRDHDEFLTKLGVDFDRVQPRMTRDFEISFNNHQDAAKAVMSLHNVQIDNEPVFNEIELRENTIFVTLTYSKDIQSKVIESNGKNLDAEKELVYVAVKNGHHCQKGYVYTDIANFGPKIFPVWHLYDKLTNQFPRKV